MEKQTGQEYREASGMRPLTSGKTAPGVRKSALFGKVLAGSCMGVLCGVLLTLIAEEPAHAEFLDIHQPRNIAELLGIHSDAPTAAADTGDALDSMTREELALHASTVDDYRFRIPAWSKPQRRIQSLMVTATAYNNVRAQTDETPDIAAWGDRIQPGMSLIAVSRDLVKMGLKRGTKVRISGIDGEFVVLDKMNKRFQRRIDIYMGKDIRAARRCGRKNVVLTWNTDASTDASTLIASR